MDLAFLQVHKRMHCCQRPRTHNLPSAQAHMPACIHNIHS